MFGRRRSAQGQTSPEYMMVIAVVTIAVVGAAYAFVPSFRNGTVALGGEVRDILGTGVARGSGGGVVGNSATGNAANGNGATNPNGTSNGGSGANGSGAGGGLGQVAGSTNGSSAGGAVGGGTGGSGSNGGVASAPDTRHTRTRGGVCIFGVCIGQTRETAVGGGTGGDLDAKALSLESGRDLEQIKGAWKSFYQENVSAAASGASAALADRPLCGPAIVAALTGMTVDQAYRELENNGRLALVKQETIVAGIVTKTKYVTTGVMRHQQLADALRQDYGIDASVPGKPQTVADVQAALRNGKSPIVLYDNGDGSGKNGHFGVVTDVADGLGVKVDTATGSFWIPKDEFQKRMDVMGGKTINVTPPPGRSLAYSP